MQPFWSYKKCDQCLQSWGSPEQISGKCFSDSIFFHPRKLSSSKLGTELIGHHLEWGMATVCIRLEIKGSSYLGIREVSLYSPYTRWCPSITVAHRTQLLNNISSLQGRPNKTILIMQISILIMVHYLFLSRTFVEFYKISVNSSNTCINEAS